MTYLGLKIAASGALFLFVAFPLLASERQRSWIAATGVACFACGFAAFVIGLLLAIWL